MKALVLAAGYGSRLSPLTDILPKCLMPINGTPLLHYWICDLLQAGANEILINTHYKSEMVKDFVKNQFYNHKVEFVFEEKLLGTAGTLFKNKIFFQNTNFLVVHSDNYTDLNLNELKKFHLNFRPDIPFTITTFFSNNPSQCGVVKTEDYILKSFVEKPTFPETNLSNCAIYFFGDEFYNKVDNAENMKDISVDLIPNFDGEIKCFHHDGFNIDIGTFDAFKRAQNIIQHKQCEPYVKSELNEKYKTIFELLEQRG